MLIQLYLLQVNVDGTISFTNPFKINPPTLFPGHVEGLSNLSLNPGPDGQTVIAPFWANIDTRAQGQVRYKTYTEGEDFDSDDLLEMVSTYVNSQISNRNFTGQYC